MGIVGRQSKGDMGAAAVARAGMPKGGRSRLAFLRLDRLRPDSIRLRRLRLDRAHVAALLILAVVFVLYHHRIASWLIDGDEEGYLYAAWRISLGQLPYRDFVTPQLPAFLFPGALLIALFGRTTAVLRTWSVLLTLTAGGATYLTGRRLFGPAAGLAAMAVLLVLADVFIVARAFRPEATMLAMGAIAMYLFVRADTRSAGSSSPDRPEDVQDRSESDQPESDQPESDQPESDERESDQPDSSPIHSDRRGYALASVFFGLAFLAKLFGVLPWAGTVAYVIAGAMTGARERSRLLGDLIALGLPGVLVVAGVMGGFVMISPDTTNDVLFHHLRQGAALSHWEVFKKGLGYYWDALNWHAPLVALMPAGLLAIRRLAPRHGWVVAWQLPTVLVFLVLSRQLWARHLVYLLPSISLIFGAAIAWAIRQPTSDRRVTFLFVAGMVAAIALPQVLDDSDEYAREEIGTARLGQMVAAVVPPEAEIVADYPGIAYYGGRTTTKTAAGLSEGAAESGQITGAKLLEEMAAADVHMVLLDNISQNGQLKDMTDYDAFQANVDAHYRLLGKFYRWYQQLSVYERDDQPGLGVDFGWTELRAARLGGDRVEAGGALPIDLVWVTKDKIDTRYTAFLHLVGPDGRTWAQGDGLLDNSLYRSTEEWEAHEVVATPLALKVEAGTPPGRYRLELGLYDRNTGKRLDWRVADGRTGDSYDVGEVLVTVPARVPNANALGFGGQSLPFFASSTTYPFRLLGSQAPLEMQAGSAVEVLTSWEVRQAPGPGAQRTMRLSMRGPGNTAPSAFAQPAVTVAEIAAPGGPDWPASAWRAGEILTVRSSATVDPMAKAGKYWLTGNWLDAAGQPLGPEVNLDLVEVHALPPMMTQLPPILRPLDGRLGEGIQLLGSDLPLTATVTAGTALEFTLYWRAQQVQPKPYTVLVHVVDGAGKVAAQADGPPADGARPVTSWRPGEVIADRRRVMLPAGMAEGEYAVLVGLYDAADPTYARLRAVVGGKVVDDGRVAVGMVSAKSDNGH